MGNTATITTAQAIAQVTAALEAQGKFSIGNSLDALIGVVAADAPALQSFLNDMMTKKGILTAQDEITLNNLLAQAETEKQNRQRIRTSNAIIIGIIAVAVGGIIYFLIRKKAT